ADRAPDSFRAPKDRRVLVVGASGFLGRSVVRALSKTGVDVRGLARDAIKGSQVRDDGGVPILGDILDGPSLKRATEGCWGVIHLAANPPPGVDPVRVRVEGTRNLVEAARREGVARLLIGSGYWVYRGRSALIDENSPVDPRGESRTNYDAERAGLEANSKDGLDVLVARPGMVYGDGSWFRGLAESIRSGEYRVVGDGKNRWSFIEQWDAGAAFEAVLRLGRAGEVYNLVDGNPAPLREFADFVAAELGVPPPRTVGLEEAANQMGDVVARHLAADRPTAGNKLRGLGWRPKFSSYRAGVPGLLRAMFPSGQATP
ncbi:MAG: NAD-dependent epimerase/dehydratase family protein, partial [Candidatus Lutacidiplasmatales archaeon]